MKSIFQPLKGRRHFAPPMDEVRRVRKFERGLNLAIRKLIVGQHLDTYAEVVDRALAIEEDNANY